MYELARHINNVDLKKKFPWFYQIRQILIKCGLMNMWNNDNFVNVNWLKATVKQKLKDLFLLEWYSLVENSNKSKVYKIFKKSFGFENYLKTTPPNLLIYMIRFRTRNHRLPVEIGNWHRIPSNLRYCSHCPDKIGDEFHYLFECTKYTNERKRFIKPYFLRRPNMYKFEQLMSTSSQIENIKLCKFIKCILSGIRN